MEKSFASLLRHSRLSSYDRTLEQVYTSPKRFKRIGDWGLKRNLPTVIRTNNVTIGALDTAEHQTPWESGNGKVLFIRRWKENFPNSKKPLPRPEEIQHNAATMTPAEFQRLLKRSEKYKAKEFQEKLKNKELLPEQVFDYLQVSFATDPSESTAANDGVVGPTYSDYEVGWHYPVQGRILNMDRMGHAVGVGGVVALMAKRTSLGLRNSGDRAPRTFYVRNAEIDPQGRPKVEVTIQPNATSTSIPLLYDYTNFDSLDYLNDSNRNVDMTADDMMHPKRYQRQGRSQGATAETDNVTPNPEHNDLMSRISGLLTNSKKN
ncbi:hypothetical protein [Parasitella parasitica]|uniref:Uncharacterized protein n=1 Tax=Parasitella parasitica TaxID=35722 RepID=A0A0B7NH01_9FUNG|nr:hypothetical protein [Parasitella parasitica]